MILVFVQLLCHKYTTYILYIERKQFFYRKYNIFQIQSNDTMVTTSKVSRFCHAS